MLDPVKLSLNEWHQRFLQQAGWTKEVRRYVFNLVKPLPGDQFLEVGSGTGAILSSLSTTGDFHLTGIDIDHPSLVFSKQLDPTFNHAQADGHTLPFPNEIFSASLCHYLLLWVQNPGQILSEMRRVTRPGGCVIALAEPDHQSRIDYPAPFDSLGALQTQALQEQGADTALGRKLSLLFHKAGLREIETGILGAQWTEQSQQTGDADALEWMTLRSDLAGKLTEAELSHFQEVEQGSRQSGARVLYIPTFYAVGLVP